MAAGDITSACLACTTAKLKPIDWIQNIHLSFTRREILFAYVCLTVIVSSLMIHSEMSAVIFLDLLH